MKKMLLVAAVMWAAFVVQAVPSTSTLYWQVTYSGSDTYSVSAAKLFWQASADSAKTCIDTWYAEDHPYEMFPGTVTAYSENIPVTEEGTYLFSVQLLADDGYVWTSSESKAATFTLVKDYEGDEGHFEPDYGKDLYGDNLHSLDFNSGTWSKSIPEPTSALLLLLGFAGLALKRKK